MSDYSTKDVINYSIRGDGAKAQEAIQGVVAAKVMRAIESKKAEVAQAMFSGALNLKDTVSNATGTPKPHVADPGLGPQDKGNSGEEAS